MKLRTLTTVLVCFGLAACATTKKPNQAQVVNANQMGQATSAQGAQAQGVNGQASFAGNNTALPPSLRAPADQTYHFAFNKSNVANTDDGSIQAQANYLITHATAKVQLQGNTDNRGSREYNIALGWRRAKAVAQVLEQDGVSPKQIAMVSYGQEKPVALGESSSARAQNRRVDLVYKSY